MLSFASSPGALFNRIGKLGLVIKALKSYQSSQLTNLTDTTNGVVAQYNSESDLQALIGSAYIGALNNADTVGGLMQSVAIQTINRMVYRDNPRISQNLQSLNVTASIQEVIRQMRVAGASVLAMVVGNTISQFSALVSNQGNGVLVVSTKEPTGGLTLENAFAETIQILCSADSYTGGATTGNEQFTLSGSGSETDLFAFDWPLGSNASQSYQAINGNANNSQGNLLTNSGFSSWSLTNTPGNYLIANGTPGTNIFQETSLTYDNSSSALRLLGDSATLVEIRQQFAASTGTQGTLQPSSQYGFALFARRDGIAPASGLAAIELVDSNFNVIKDNNAVSNTFNVDLTQLTTNYAPFTGVFRTPIVMPSAYYWRLRLINPITTGRSVYFDRAGLGSMSQLYPSGPYFSLFSGGNNFVKGDLATCQISNSRGAGGTLSTFQTLFSQLLPVLANGYLLPSSSTPSIPDTLIG